MDEHRAALDVRQELVAEARPLGGALDQPGDVGEHGLPLLALDRAENRRERREGVVGHLRRRPRQPREQRGLAGVRQPDEPGVGEQLQPQLDPARSPRRPRSRRSAAPAGSRSRSACCRALRGRRVATTARCPASTRSKPSPSSAVPWVPGGTGITWSSPRAPCCSPLRHGLPRAGAEVLAPRSGARSRREGSQTRTTSPPWPPSPPSGPPRGTCASRRKLTHAVAARRRPRPRCVRCRGTRGTLSGTARTGARLRSRHR